MSRKSTNPSDYRIMLFHYNADSGRQLLIDFFKSLKFRRRDHEVFLKSGNLHLQNMQAEKRLDFVHQQSDGRFEYGESYLTFSKTKDQPGDYLDKCVQILINEQGYRPGSKSINLDTESLSNVKLELESGFTPRKFDIQYSADYIYRTPRIFHVKLNTISRQQWNDSPEDYLKITAYGDCSRDRFLLDDVTQPVMNAIDNALAVGSFEPVKLEELIQRID